MSDTGGIVLAAGSSQRMGGDTTKQLLRFGGRTMVQSVVDTAESSSLDRVVVVTGANAAAVTAELVTSRAVVVHNADHREGNVTSLRVGLDALGSCAAVVLLLGDMPSVDMGIIETMLEHWRSHGSWGAVAVYDDGAPNHPFLLSAGAVDALGSTRGAKVLWRLLVTEPPHHVDRVRFHRPPPVDVDTPEDYLDALRQMGIADERGDVTPGI
jgi:molybdenum cofactor cytidylyltransferase